MNIRSIRAIEIELHPDLKTKPRSESKKHSNILNRRFSLLWNLIQVAELPLSVGACLVDSSPVAVEET